MIRNTAAEQLADVQKQHPEDLFNLLNRVVPFLRSKSWETRVAAAKAVGGIVANAEKYDPNAEDEPIKPEVKAETNGHAKEEDADDAAVKKEENGDVEMPLAPAAHAKFDLNTLDIAAILKDGSHLVGAASKELEFKLLSMNPADRLAYQKEVLPKRLGLEGPFAEITSAPVDETIAQTPGLRTPAIHRISKARYPQTRSKGHSNPDSVDSPSKKDFSGITAPLNSLTNFASSSPPLRSSEK